MANLSKSMKRAFFVMGIAFFFLIVATSITLYFANKDFEPVIDPNYYEKGLNYDKEISQKKELIAEGYHYETTLLTERYPLKTGKNQVKVRILKNDSKIEDVKMNLVWERPATHKFTKKIRMDFSKEESSYVGQVDIPFYGKWFVTLSSVIDGKVFEKTIPIIVK